MSRIKPAPEVGDDFEHILDPLTSHEVAHAADRRLGIIEAIGVLASDPLIGAQPSTTSASS
ncbi:hypothetical protein [Rhodanobacter hydrolyticus]|uniref:hypothetical protein n=1 Tax=Rhodanobacter hydrolyticus TaxID=2250595 RepID=UPI00384EFA0A